MPIVDGGQDFPGLPVIGQDTPEVETDTLTIDECPCGEPTILVTSDCPITAGVSGTAYTYTFTESGGTAPYTWSIESGGLATGLSLSSAGDVSGTPSAAGTFPFVVKVVDANGLTTCKSCSMVVTAPAHTCPCVPSSYVVGETISDDFVRADGPGFQLAAWREVQVTIAPPAVGTVRIASNELEEQRNTPDASTCCGGIRQDVTPGSDWRVKAIWGTADFRAGGSQGAVMILAAPITQAVPADPLPATNTLSYYFWRCQKSGPTSWQFILGRIDNGNVLTTFLGAVTVNAPDFGPGHEYSLEVFCNNLGTCTTVRGLVDGVIKVSKTSGAGNQPSGLPGCGNLFEQLLGDPGNTASIDSWTAERLI